MLFFSGCKINLGLRILDQRADGYHNIETVLVPVPWHDAIEYLPATEPSLEVLGRTLDGNVNDNYVLRAYRLMHEKFPLPPLQFKLLKNVPAGAGLGSGSANAAATLKKLNEDLKANLNDDELETIASRIGSDCAFFIRNQTSLATGRGEILTPTKVDLHGLWLLVIYPDIGINTAWAYSRVKSEKFKVQSDGNTSLAEVVKMPVREWKKCLSNDFEDVVFAAHPRLKTVKEFLYERGALYASLSGSGSSLFGLFEAKPDADALAKKINVERSNLFFHRY